METRKNPGQPNRGCKKNHVDTAKSKTDLPSEKYSTTINYTRLGEITLPVPGFSLLDNTGWAYDEQPITEHNRFCPSGMNTAWVVWRTRPRKNTVEGDPDVATPTCLKGENSEMSLLHSNRTNDICLQNPRSTYGGQCPPGEPHRNVDPVTPQGARGATSYTPTPPGVGDENTVTRLKTHEDIFHTLPSVISMATGKNRVMVGFDTEFHYTDDGERVVDSWQFVLLHPEDPSRVYEVVFLPMTGVPLRLTTIVGHLIRVTRLDMTVPGWKPQGLKVTSTKRGKNHTEGYSYRSKNALRLCLLAHYGQADLSTFYPEDLTREKRKPTAFDLMRYTIRVAGGLCTSSSVYVPCPGANYRWSRPVKLDIRDTMALSADGTSLAVLAKTIGMEKILTGENDAYKTRMGDYRRDHLIDFLAYGINDAAICLEYVAAQWGDGVLPPISISTGAASAVRYSVSTALDLDPGDSDQFNRHFRGMCSVDETVCVADGDGGSAELGFFTRNSLRSINLSSEKLSIAFSKSYYGGLNSADHVGLYPDVPTFDFDLQSAYPTAMACIPQPDWTHPDGVIAREMHDTTLKPGDVPRINFPCVAAVAAFEFPPGVEWPCLPIDVDGAPINTRTSRGLDHEQVWVSGPELWLALRLGARITVEDFYEYRVIDENPYVLGYAVTNLVRDRKVCKETYGKKSVQELTLKLAVNGTYGKTAQAVRGQNAWNAMSQDMEGLGASAITSPVHASMTTSIVRAVLAATMNQLTTRGYRVFSVTTDGFITDAPEEVVKNLDLFGARTVLEDARIRLTGKPDVWEIKHTQRGVYNMTTRGNIGVEDGGVLARAGFKTTEIAEKGSTDERAKLLDLVATRTARIHNPYTKMTGFKELSKIEDRETFRSIRMERTKHFEYDLKRKPASIEGHAVYQGRDGTPHDVAQVKTTAWETIRDYENAREHLDTWVKRQGRVLRTRRDWREFIFKLDRSSMTRQITSMDRTLLVSVLIHYRTGGILIGVLDDMSVADKCAALSRLGLGEVSRNDWKNARRPERRQHALPETDPYMRDLKKFLSTWDGETPWVFTPDTHPVGVANDTQMDYGAVG